jgi:hypothetical protein
MQVESVGDETCRMIWVSDFLPDDAASVVAPSSSKARLRCNAP